MAYLEAMSETIFARLLRGDLPCHRVYEDDLVFAFLDIAPLSPGHTLLIPRRAAPTMDALDDASAAALGRVLPRLCRAIVAATGVADYNILQNNGRLAHQEVMHVHLHIIPRPDRMRGLELGWRPAALEPSHAATLSATIAAHLGGGQSRP